MTKILKIAKDSVKVLLLAFASLSFVILFIILSVPVYVFRYFVIILAKVARRDLEEILSGFSSLFVNDYFAKTPSSRVNTVVPMIFQQGHISLQEIRTRVMSNWIHARDSSGGELEYKKFQQYPERWLGFTFWKKSKSFSIDNHVLLACDKGKLVNKEELNNIVENLLNSHFPREQSPWGLYLIEHYTDSCIEHDQKSVLIFKAHHALADGYSILTALLEGLYEYSMDNVTVAPQVAKRSLAQKLWFIFSIPFVGLSEMLRILAHMFKDIPWRIPDERKEWYQLCAKSKPVPIQTVKDIKNHFEVSFTSVILSSISAAIHKSLEASNTGQCNSKSMLCVSALPVIGQEKKRKLTNQLTAVLFSIPTGSVHSPVERLRTLHCVMKSTQQSALPFLVQILVAVMGAHFYKVCEVIMKNRSVSTGLTNFPGVPMEIQFNGRPLVNVDFVTGGQQGDTGLGIMVLSYNQHIRVSITVEKALMSRREANQFLSYLTEEIQLLYSLIKEKNV